MKITQQLTHILWLVGNLLFRAHQQAQLQSARYTIKLKSLQDYGREIQPQSRYSFKTRLLINMNTKFIKEKCWRRAKDFTTCINTKDKKFLQQCACCLSSLSISGIMAKEFILSLHNIFPFMFVSPRMQKSSFCVLSRISTICKVDEIVYSLKNICFYGRRN